MGDWKLDPRFNGAAELAKQPKLRVNCEKCGRLIWLDMTDVAIISATSDDSESWGDGLLCDRCRPTTLAADLGLERCPNCDSVLSGGVCYGCNRSYAPSR
jgi:hypothetical protein